MTLCLHSFTVINISFILLVATRTFHFIFALVISHYTLLPSSPSAYYNFFFFLLLTFVHSSLFPALFARYFPSLFNLSLTFQIIFSLHVNYKVKKHIRGIRNDCPENRDICLEEHVIYLGDITHLYIRRTKRDL